MEQTQSSTNIAGVDVGKHWLDAAMHRQPQTLRVANDETGLAQLVAWLASQAVGRVGLEASGGYEQAVRSALEAAGLEVVVHQPLEVRLPARLKRLRAKTDRIDAALIAAATAQVEAVRAAQDLRLAELAQRLTAYEQISDQTAKLKTFMEHVTLDDLAASLREEIARLVRPRLAWSRRSRPGSRPGPTSWPAIACCCRCRA